MAYSCMKGKTTDSSRGKYGSSRATVNLSIYYANTAR
jgi:hypothetical protein